MVASASGGATSGYVRIYHYVSPSWSQKGSAWNGYQCSTISSDGTTVVMGSTGTPYGSSSTNAGFVKILRYDSSSWNQLGLNLTGTSAQDLFGYALASSADGNTVFIGAPSDGSKAGYVRAFTYENSAWTQMGSDIVNSNAQLAFGTFVSASADGNVVVIGQQGGSTHVRVYRYVNNAWIPKGSDIAVGNGKSVAMSPNGTVVLVGDSSRSPGEAYLLRYM